MDYPKEREHNGQTGARFYHDSRLVHPILSRFAVPPVPEKEQRINPDIKRLQPTPSYEKHRVVCPGDFHTHCLGIDLPGG